MNKYIDYTNLKSTATMRDIEKLCDEAIKHQFSSVYVHPYYVKLAHELLQETNVLVGTVVGFPLGMNTTETKVYEAIDAIQNGADEIDMVINMGALKNNDYEYIQNEIEEIRDAIDGKTLKVIIETCYLTEEEIIKMVEICNKTFVHYIKTSTGFGTMGARIEDVELMKKHASETLEIKASGGIKTYDQMVEFIEAGATKIGTSNAIDIMEGKK